MRRKKSLVVVFVALAVAGISLGPLLDSVYRIPVLMYHSIDYTTDKKDRMTVSPEVFARQMKYLRDHKYNVISISDAVSYIRDRKKPPKKTVAITIDDGYRNNYTYAYPVLKKYNMPATVFVIVKLVGKEGFMTWNELKEISGSGIIDIESHTLSHRYLPYINDNELSHQLRDSKKILEDRLGRRVAYLCYPMGQFDERVKKAAIQAGYKAAFATKPTRMSPNYDIYEIKRVRISPTSNNLFVFGIKVSGYHAFFRVIQNDYKDVPLIRLRRGSRTK